MRARVNLGARVRAGAHAVGVRSAETKGLVDTFLICTVVTILAVRFFLIALGYPQLGGDGLHIAHLLWGGLLMLIALLLAIVSISDVARRVAAVAGGVGFGLMIDEIGKFVTSDNNYFFRPAFSLIYVTLVLVWLASRTLLLRAELRPEERVANAIDYLKESTLRPLTDREVARALELVERRPDEDPLAPAVRELLESVRTVPAHEPEGRRLLGRAKAFYERIATTRGFRLLVTAIFVLLLLLALVSIASFLVDLVQGNTLKFTSWAQFVTNIVLAVLYLLGIAAIFQKSRIVAYRWFELSMLFSIFIVQIFDFTDLQLLAAAELVVTVGLLVTLRLLIAEEERHGRTAPPLTPALLRTARQSASV